MEKNVTVKKKQVQTDTKTAVLTAPAQAVTEILITKAEEALPDRTKGIVHWGEEKNTLPYYLL